MGQGAKGRIQAFAQRDMMEGIFDIILPMYNYQTYRKEQELTRKFEEIRKDHSRTALYREKSNPTLVHSHKKRIEGFILSMLDKPIAVTQHSNQPHAFREHEPSKNLAANAFYLKHQNQAQRLKESQQHNSELDQVPFRNTFSHRFRETDPQVRPMKYKPLTHNLRLKEYLDNQSLNYLPNTVNHKLDRILQRTQPKTTSDRDSLNKTVTKSLLPLLHSKTYFKSVETLFAELPKQWPEGVIYEKQLTTEESYEEGEVQVKREAKKGNDHLSRKQNSREALLKCNMLHAREPSSLTHSQSSYTGAIRA